MYRTRLDTQSSERIADLAVNRTGDLTAAGDGRTYLLADIRGNSPEPRPLLLELGGDTIAPLDGDPARG